MAEARDASGREVGVTLSEAEAACRAAGIAYAQAVNAKASVAEVDALADELLRLSEHVVAMKGEARPGDRHALPRTVAGAHVPGQRMSRARLRGAEPHEAFPLVKEPVQRTRPLIP